MLNPRRTFLKRSLFAALVVTPRSWRWVLPSVHAWERLATDRDEFPRANDPTLKTLALRALDAATAAGATYADVRFTSTRRRSLHVNLSGPPVAESHEL